jgi:hypothetical protein
MKPFYTAYAKSINGITFYFVKSFQTFPEYKNVPPILQSYGMHTDFKRACSIAQVTDKEIKLQLLNEIEVNAPSVLPMYPAAAKVYKLRKMQTSFPSILKLLRLG